MSGEEVCRSLPPALTRTDQDEYKPPTDEEKRAMEKA